MKKVSLFLGMVLVAGMAMSQNKAVTTQTGKENEATVTQVGSNDATVIQTGDENVGVTDQLNGNGNTISIEQKNGNKNEAYVTQGMVTNYGGLTSSNVPGTLNKATVVQSGSANVVGEFIQVGDKNEGSVSQTGVGNSAYAYQGWAYGFWGETAITSALSSTNSTVSITQIQDNNQSAVWQYGGDNNDATISQDGEANIARIAQGFIYTDAPYNFSNPVYNTKDNTATIIQSGDGNAAKLFQLGDANSFTLTQSGGGNKVGVAAGGLLEARNGYFEQDGDGNIFVGAQANGATLDNTSKQDGDGNYINMSQGGGDVAKIIQDGDLNDAFLTQMGGGQNATILQTGDSNIATVSQQ